MSDPTLPMSDLNSGARGMPLRIEQIGAYRILELLGEGGMGEVYKAERRQPMRQTVAIKIIRLGFASKEVVARFESERQALARMDHQNVARVLDAGISDDGRPYFVMEYVPGLPITQFCDDNKLSIKERLLLFTQACDAITHAHTKAVIHRDVKSGNVLAYLHDGKPTVKVIDFGIAKALTGDRLTDVTFNTDQGRIIGTYDSMSPEQADGSPDIDTRTDVYSLGVLLYELLTGMRPFDHGTLAQAADQEIKRIIREVEPPRPSNRLTTLGDAATKFANVRQSRVDSLARELRSELEWIPLKAMRKERERRYTSPQQLAEDVHSYLAGRPLLAAPESRLYRLRKFVKRRRAPLATAAVFLLLAAIGTIVYVHDLRREQARTLAALKAAEDSSHTTAAVNEFLHEMLSSVNPSNAKGREVLVRDVLDAAARDAQSKLANRQVVLGEVLLTLGETYNAIGQPQTARTLLERARELLLSSAGPRYRATIVAEGSLAGVQRDMGEYEQAEKTGRAALADARQALGDNDRTTLATLTSLAITLQQAAKDSEAEALFRESLDRRQATFGPDDPDTLNSLHNLAYHFQSTGQFREAEPLARDVAARRARVFGQLHPDTLSSIQILGSALQSQGRYNEAEPLFEDLLERSRKLYGEQHILTNFALAELARIRFRAGKIPEAEALLTTALQRARTLQGDEHPDTLQMVNDLAFVRQRLGKMPEAEPLFRETLERRERKLGPDHPATLESAANLAGLLIILGPEHQDEATRLAVRALEGRRRAAGPTHVVTLSSMSLLANISMTTGNVDEAIRLSKELYDLVPQAQVPPVDAAHFRSLYGLSLARAGRFEEALPPMRAATERWDAAPAAKTAPAYRKLLEQLAIACEKMNHPDEAAKWRAALAALGPGPSIAPSTTPSTSPSTAPAR
ncbi:MAG: serine/threonine protein kinase [Anaerolineae bacterium]|nr:serine/threonine protein kinase [Phycisphaerae bacterium]